MPLVKLQTNLDLDSSTTQTLIKQTSSLTASLLSKPESYVMVIAETSCSMLFAGSNEPLCYIELKSIGLPENETPSISAALCQLVNDIAGINPERIYIEFTNAPRAMWGWNSATF